MIKNSSDNMQHDNEIFNDVVQLESLASSLAPSDNNINTVLVTMNPYYEATNQEFQDNQAFTIDVYSFNAFVFKRNTTFSTQLTEQLGPHPTKNAAFSSSFSSLYTPQICHDLLPMIQCRLLLHSSLVPS